MKKKRLELLLIALTVLAMGAGVAAGLLAARLPAAATITSTSTDVTPLVIELQLTPSQRDQMRTIWEGVRVDIRDSFDRAQRLQKQRDDAIFALLTDEQRARFEIIAREYADRFSDLTRERDQAFATAVEQTKTLLTEQQQQKYEQILRSRGAIPAMPAAQETQSR